MESSCDMDTGAPFDRFSSPGKPAIVRHPGEKKGFFQ
jgi:hypothetical protein